MTTSPPPTWPEDIDVLSLDLDMRDAPPSTAEENVFGAIRQLDSAQRVFLKIDSTLRGPIAAMLRGALRANVRYVAVVAPAFPEQGRRFENGQLLVNGEPKAHLNDILPERPRTVIIDDPDRVVEEVDSHPEWLLVGSAGLARRLAPAAPPLRIPVLEDGPVLLVAGSPSASTRTQLLRLGIRSDLVVLTTPPSRERDRGEASSRLAAEVAHWAQGQRPRALVLTGGATARAVCDRLGVTGLRIVGELEPGIPIGTLEGGPWNGVTVVTKAGGFGMPDTLLDVARALS